MAPIITIVLCAILGLYLYGVLGAVLGAVAGYLLSMLIGTIAAAWGGGLLPRKLRQRTALFFYMNHQPTIDAYVHGTSEQEKLRLIEGLIERIFRRATVKAPLLSKSMGMSYREVEEAAEQEATAAENPKVREVILLLKDHILQTLY